MSTLADEYPKQQARVRELLEDYKSLRNTPGVAPEFGIMCLEKVIKEAEEAQASGDIVRMLATYKRMEACK